MRKNLPMRNSPNFVQLVHPHLIVEIAISELIGLGLEGYQCAPEQATLRQQNLTAYGRR